MSFEHEFSDNTKRGCSTTNSLRNFIEYNKMKMIEWRVMTYKVKIGILSFVSTGDSPVCEYNLDFTNVVER